MRKVTTDHDYIASMISLISKTLPDYDDLEGVTGLDVWMVLHVVAEGLTVYFEESNPGFESDRFWEESLGGTPIGFRKAEGGVGNWNECKNKVHALTGDWIVNDKECRPAHAPPTGNN